MAFDIDEFQELKNQIASFNELVMVFLKEKFQSYEGYEEFIKRVKEIYPKVVYKIEPLTNGGACFYSENDGEELKYTIAINNCTLKNFSSEK